MSGSAQSGSGKKGHQHRRWRISGKKAHLDHVRNDINVTPLVRFRRRIALRRRATDGRLCCTRRG
jgi:hypothetical protein